MIALLSMSIEILFEAFGGEWLFGNIGCKVSTYVQCMLFASTAFILMSMSYDRFEAICRPMFLSRTLSRSRRMIIYSWIIAAVIAIPQVFIFLEVCSRQRWHFKSKIGRTKFRALIHRAESRWPAQASKVVCPVGRQGLQNMKLTAKKRMWVFLVQRSETKYAAMLPRKKSLKRLQFRCEPLPPFHHFPLDFFSVRKKNIAHI